MNREILFRGKREDNGEWSVGSLLYYSDGDAFICCEDYIPSVLNKYQVVTDTIGQYTGLIDKNGKKIFEGDVVKYIYGESFSDDEKPEDATYKYKQQGVVRYTDGKFFPAPMRVDIEDYWYSYGLFDFEIIGNIHDNPELLEGGDTDA